MLSYRRLWLLLQRGIGLFTSNRLCLFVTIPIFMPTLIPPPPPPIPPHPPLCAPLDALLALDLLQLPFNWFGDQSKCPALTVPPPNQQSQPTLLLPQLSPASLLQRKDKRLLYKHLKPTRRARVRKRRSLLTWYHWVLLARSMWHWTSWCPSLRLTCSMCPTLYWILPLRLVVWCAPACMSTTRFGALMKFASRKEERR